MNEPMSLREAAAELNLQVDTLRKYAERGKIPAKKVGQKWCLPKAWVDDEKKVREQPLWVKERAQPEEQAPSKVGEIDSLLQEQRIQHQHIKSVLILLEAYVSQLREPYEPEDFVTPPGKEALSQKEFDYWYYAKRAIPSLEVFIDSQIDSESLAITAKLESEPSFTALKDHYKSSKLWQDIERYKRLRGQYWSIGFKLHRTIMELCSGPFAEETKAEVLRNAIREWRTRNLHQSG